MADPGTSKARNRARELQSQGLDIIDLSAGELDCELFPPLKDGAQLAIREPRHRYTPILGIPALREAIAHRTSQETGCHFAPDEIGLSAGAKPALYYAILALTDPGDEVIVPLPCWGTFLEQISLAGAIPVTVELSVPDFRLDMASLYAATGPRTKLLIVNTPSNPTGIVLNDKELSEIGEFARTTGITLLVDECYSRLLRDNRSYRSILEIDPELKDRVLRFNSYSKAYAMAGWRLGYFTGPPDIVAAIQKIQGHLASNPGSISQRALLHALQDDDQDYIANVNAYLDENHAQLMQALSSYPEVLHYRPEGAFYAFLSTASFATEQASSAPPQNPFDFAEDMLSHAGIAVTCGSAFGMPSYLRLSYTVQPNFFRQGLDRLVDYIERCRKGIVGPHSAHKFMASR
jgi:aspartate aminotransferase